MNSDEVKGLRLQRTRVIAELARINNLLNDWDLNNPQGTKGWVPKTAQGTDREKFYRDAENDFHNTDSNGNFVSPDDC